MEERVSTVGIEYPGSEIDDRGCLKWRLDDCVSQMVNYVEDAGFWLKEELGNTPVHICARINSKWGEWKRE